MLIFLEFVVDFPFSIRTQIGQKMSYRRPSCGEQVASGAMMGAMIGGTFGLLMGGYQLFGLRGTVKLSGRDTIRVLGMAILQSGAAFGFFLGVGTALRCEDSRPLISSTHQAWSSSWADRFVAKNDKTVV
jgi:predicted lipid-binding transport protein (Tim44 family)